MSGIGFAVGPQGAQDSLGFSPESPTSWANSNAWAPSFPGKQTLRWHSVCGMSIRGRPGDEVKEAGQGSRELPIPGGRCNKRLGQTTGQTHRCSELSGPRSCPMSGPCRSQG